MSKETGQFLGVSAHERLGTLKVYSKLFARPAVLSTGFASEKGPRALYSGRVECRRGDLTL